MSFSNYKSFNNSFPNHSLIKKMPENAFFEYDQLKLGAGNFDYPPILIGTMFYQNQRLLDPKDPTRYNRQKAIKRIQQQKRCNSKNTIHTRTSERTQIRQNKTNPRRHKISSDCSISHHAFYSIKILSISRRCSATFFPFSVNETSTVKGNFFFPFSLIRPSFRSFGSAL